MRTRLLTVAKRRLGSIGAARGVCSHPGRAARHESPEGELRRLAGYDQTLARRGSFLRPDRWPLDVLTESTASATLGSTAQKLADSVCCIAWSKSQGFTVYCCN